MRRGTRITLSIAAALAPVALISTAFIEPWLPFAIIIGALFCVLLAGLGYAAYEALGD